MAQVKEKNWLVFWTVSGQEMRTKRRIEKLVKDLGLEDKVESVFVPTIRVSRFIKKKRRPRLVDIVIEAWEDGLPVGFLKLISPYPIGFTGKSKELPDLPFPYTPLKRGLYRFEKVDRYRLEDLFRTLRAYGFKPVILGVNERKLPEFERNLREWGIGFSHRRSALKPGEGQYETVEEMRIVEKPIYKGYIFIKMENDQRVIDKITQIISRTRPIRARDPETGEPAYLRMPEEDIRKIEELIKQQEEESQREIPFAVGDKVRIVDGVFKGREGEVMAVDAEKGIVTVRIVEFGKPQNIPFRFSMVDRIS